MEINMRSLIIDHPQAMTLAATEYDRVVTVFESLSGDQWSSPTDCTEWDVRAMAGHMLGMAQMVAEMSEMIRQQVTSQRDARREGTLPIDSLTALQVTKNADLSTGEVVAEMRIAAPKAARQRRRMPTMMRNMAMPDTQVIDGHRERWTVGYLVDIILTRDPFMHRIDISRATGQPIELTPEHDGVLVDDVVHEWAARHRQPFMLELTGPAGGRWRRGDKGEAISMDALEFCRALAGRADPTGLLTQQVPF